MKALALYVLAVMILGSLVGCAGQPIFQHVSISLQPLEPPTCPACAGQYYTPIHHRGHR